MIQAIQRAVARLRLWWRGQPVAEAEDQTCPRCLSPNLHWKQPAILLWWRCDECGFTFIDPGHAEQMEPTVLHTIQQWEALEQIRRRQDWGADGWRCTTPPSTQSTRPQL